MSTKIFMWIATGLLAVGLILFAVVMTGYNWDFRKMSSKGFLTNTHTITDDFHSISMDTGTADITYLPSTDGSCRVVCQEKSNTPHCVSVENGVLRISKSNDIKWYEMLLNFGTPKITVYLPDTQYQSLTIQGSTGDVEISENLQFADVNVSITTGNVSCCASVSGALKLKTGTGDIRVRNLSVGSMELTVTTGKVQAESVDCQENIQLSVSTGKAEFTNVSCRSVTSGGSTGDFTMKNVIANGKITVKRSTGDVVFSQCDAEEISVQTNTGNVTGSFLTDKIVFAQTDTGKVNVPKSTTGGRCEISTTTGDITVTVSP